MKENKEVEVLLNQFISLDGAARVCEVVDTNREALQSPDRNVSSPAYSMLSAYTIELFAYHHQLKRLPAGHALLSPSTTLDLYARTTGRATSVTPEGMVTIEGLSIPDGIEIDLNEQGEYVKLVRLHEYKGSKKFRTERQMRQMYSLLKTPRLQSDLGITDPSGCARAGTILSELAGTNNSRPVILEGDHELTYTLANNSDIGRQGYPPRVSMDFLPFTTLTLRKLTEAIIGI